jgi:indole-3-glycerol phosphate synthase
MSVLDQIIASKKSEVAEKKRIVPQNELIRQVDNSRNMISLAERMYAAPGFHFICEIKKASPSKGVIQPDFDPARIARRYVQGGASAISVLTDEKYFSGSLNDLSLVRQTTALPLLRKDFIIDPYQIYESALAGANIILLIAKVLSGQQILEYRDLAAQLGLDTLVEIAIPDDLSRIPTHTGRTIIGVNNRNLDTFRVDFANSLQLKSLIPPGFQVIAESGIQTADDCLFLRKSGFSGALIGETLMKAANPTALLKNFIERVSHDLPA